MDQLRSHNISALTQSIKAHNYLIKLTQLLVSVSVFSFLFSPSSLPAFLHHFNFYFSTFPLQLFAHTLDKNIMFLLCNGLLVFVGITRSFSGSTNRDDEPSKYNENGSHSSQFPDVEANKPMPEREAEEKTSDADEQTSAAEQAIEINYSAEELMVQENIEKIIVLHEEQGKESGNSVLKEKEEQSYEKNGPFDAGEEEEDKGLEIDGFLIEEKVEEEEEIVEENWVLSTEELNKKFDDFIRRMKEDLKIEAQRQLIMV